MSKDTNTLRRIAEKFRETDISLCQQIRDIANRLDSELSQRTHDRMGDTYVVPASASHGPR